MFLLQIELIVGIIHLASALETNKDSTIFLYIRIPETFTCSFPEVLEATLKRNGSSKTLHFQKIMKEIAGAHGKFSRGADLHDVQSYTDSRHQSIVEVSCITDKQAHFTTQGFITLPNGDTYSIERKRDNIHVLRLIPSLPDKITDASTSGVEDRNFRQLKNSPNHVQKRDTSAVYIDVMVLVGYSVFERWLKRSAENATLEKMQDAREQINRHFALLFNAVDQRFKTVSSQYNIKLVGIYIEDRGESEWLKSIKVIRGNKSFVYGEKLLNTVWNWTSNATGLPTHDVTVVYEFLDMHSESDGRQMASMSYGSSICNVHKKSATAVSYKDQVGYDIRNTARGLAHGLGAYTDGPPNNCSSSDYYLMSSNITSVFINNTYHFSPCSRSYIQTYIQNQLQSSNQSQSCLRETTDPVNITDVIDKFPGELYTPDQQCRQEYGDASFYCHHTDDVLHTKICDKMYCYLPGSSTCYAKVAADRTTCGNKTWCYAGECIYSDKAPTADPECVFMDQAQIGILEKKDTCPNNVADGRYFCYYASYSVSCCKSCRDHRSEDQACLYGDNLLLVANCSYEQCLSNINNTSYLSACCETCQNITKTTKTTKTATGEVNSTPTTQQTSRSTVADVKSTQTYKVSTSKAFKLAPKSSDRTGLAVGLGVGLSILVILALLVLLYMYYRSGRKNKIQPRDSKSKNET